MVSSPLCAPSWKVNLNGRYPHIAGAPLWEVALNGKCPFDERHLFLEGVLL